MQQQTITVKPDVTVNVASIPGDLRVAGWERLEVMAKTDGDELTLISSNGSIQATCDEDLIIYIPRQAALNIQQVSGDVNLQALQGPVALGPVAGDLTVNDVGPVSLDSISGDASLRKTGALTARTISGDFTLRVANGTCAIETIGGDASIRDVNGQVAIQSIGSDLYVRNIRGDINVSANADVALYVQPMPGHTYIASAGDDMIVRLPPSINIELHLAGSDPENINVNIPGVKVTGDSTIYDLVVGEKKDDLAQMFLNSGDDLLVTTQSDAWESAADFGVEMSDFSSWGVRPVPPVPPVPPLPSDFSERINRRVQLAMERAQLQIEAAGRHAEGAGRRMEAAMRRAEAKARAAEVRARRGQVNMKIGQWDWDLTPRGPVVNASAPTDEERLAILRMLQEKKITLEDAEKLLAALEGK